MPKAKVETEGKQVASPGNISSQDNLRSRVEHSAIQNIEEVQWRIAQKLWLDVRKFGINDAADKKRANVTKLRAD